MGGSDVPVRSPHDQRASVQTRTGPEPQPGADHLRSLRERRISRHIPRRAGRRAIGPCWADPAITIHCRPDDTLLTAPKGPKPDLPSLRAGPGARSPASARSLRAYTTVSTELHGQSDVICLWHS
jgi:hypothetical protein